MTGPRNVPITGIASLTPNELKVLKLVVEDWDNEDIAYILGVKENSVPTYLRIIYDKLGISSSRGKRDRLIEYAKKELGACSTCKITPCIIGEKLEL